MREIISTWSTPLEMLAHLARGEDDANKVFRWLHDTYSTDAAKMGIALKPRVGFVDANGNEIQFPIRLESDTRYLPEPRRRQTRRRASAQKAVGARRSTGDPRG